MEAGSDGQALDPHRCGDGPRPGTRPCPQKHCGCSHPSQSLHLPIPCPLGSEHRRWLIHASARPKAAGLRPRRLSTWHSFSKDSKPQTRCFLNQRTGVSLGRGKDGASRVPQAPKQWAGKVGSPQKPCRGLQARPLGSTAGRHPASARHLHRHPQRPSQAHGLGADGPRVSARLSGGSPRTQALPAQRWLSAYQGCPLHEQTERDLPGYRKALFHVIPKRSGAFHFRPGKIIMYILYPQM